MKVRVYLGGKGIERKVTKLKEEVSELEPRMVWLVEPLYEKNRIWIDDDGLEIPVGELFPPEFKEAIDFAFPTSCILSLDTLVSLWEEWPRVEEDEEEYVDIVTVSLEEAPMDLGFDRDTLEEIIAELKGHLMDWDEVEGVENDFKDDVISQMMDLRNEIMRDNNLSVMEYEDMHMWLSQEVHRLGTRLEEKIRKRIR